MLPPGGTEIDADRPRPLGRLWTVSNTLLGWAAGLGGVYRWRADGQVCEVTGGWLIRLLNRRGLADAITLGDVILYADAAMPPVLREHEMVHVRQYRAWGPLFIPAYLIETLYQQIVTGDGYRQNRFEVSAYQSGRTK